MNNTEKPKIKEGCGICGTALNYSPKPVLKHCSHCGKQHNAQIYCPNGHYVCDRCHRARAIEMAREVLKTSVSKDPIALFEKIVAHPAVTMHGPEHHAIVAGVIVAASRNSGYLAPLEAIDAALDRGSKVPGGWCGFFGACGAAIGVGIAVSVLTNATPLTGQTRALSLKATASALAQMADSDPRCCKRAGRKAIEAAIQYLDQSLGISLARSDSVTCRYSERNLECPKSLCPYYAAKPVS